MTAIVFGGLGLIIGSFLNVLILRHGVRSVGGRSSCMSCGRVLSWYELFPVFSWIALRGECRTCKAHLSVQYPLVEALTGGLFAALGASTVSLTAQLAGCVMTALLISIAVYDFRHTIIPDLWVYSFAGVTFLTQFFLIPLQEVGILAFLSGPIVAAPLFALWLFSRGAWMGFGDVKLALGMGWLLGPFYGIVALFFAFVIGAAVSVPLLLFSSESARRFLSRFTPTATSPKAGWGFTMKSEIPFGPFLVASTLIIWLLLIYQIDPLSLIGASPL